MKLPVLPALLLCAAFPAFSQTPIPGKFYEYYVVAKTGSGFTGLGTGPSINDAREVAFYGNTSAGNGLWYVSNGIQVNFNPGESFGSSDIIGQTVQINANHQVVAQDRITTTSPASTNIRLYNATSTDSFSYIARGGPSRTYDAVLINPSVNLAGDVVFGGLHTPQRVLGYAPHGGGAIVERTITTTTPKPLIADDGTVVLYNGNSTFQILAYPPGLGAPAIIADTNAHWVSLDSSPGISRDGRIIAFQGNPDAVQAAAMGTTTGAGIFAAINEGSGFASAKIIRITGGKVEDVAADRAVPKGNFDGICDVGENCVVGAELGYDAAANPITFTSYGADSRVGVTNIDFGAAGIDDDSFVISFIATPSSASRDNSALPGTPLLFSAQQGLWTIRVDVRKQLAGSNARVYLPFTPIPVAQVGDKLGPDTITGLSVYDPIANAAHDESGNIRTMRRGDHRVAFWASTAAGQIVVRANHLDSDQDGLLDHWETTGIDMDQDGAVDLQLSGYGADPFKRDLFLQVDWVGKSGVDIFKPAGGVFSSPVAGQYSIFENNLRNAEALSGPLYGFRVDGASPIDIKAGVVPHVDAGTGLDSLGLPMSINLGTAIARGGNVFGMPGDPTTLPAVIYYGQPGFTVPGVNIRAFQNIKDTYFGTADKNARMLAFHYMVFGAYQNFYPNYPKTPYTATVSSASISSIELTAPLSSFPRLGNGAFILMTSGGAAAQARQIDTKVTNGVTGNAILNIDGTWNPTPAAGDSLVFLDGSTGIAEVAFSPQPDNNSLPGNDVIVSAGAMGVLQGAPPNLCMEGETASHELGHTLGLRHGGIDQEAYHPGADYMSVMSYTWQLECNPTPQVPNYAGLLDHTFDDYANLQFNFSDVLFHLNSSLGKGRGEGTNADLQLQTPEQTLLDIIAKNGPLDSIPPTVGITSPSAGGAVAPGVALVANITATDDVAVSQVIATFDVNGNGTPDSGESVSATQTGPGTYQATFPVTSGPNGTRSISAIAFDTWSNTKLAAITVTVSNPGACDVTGDGSATIADVQQIVDEIKGTLQTAHDLNGDSKVDVLDAQIAINAAMGLGCSAH